MLAQLRHGNDFFGDAFGDRRYADYGLMNRVWREHKAAVLEATARRKGPGYRPWAWWQFDTEQQRNDAETEPEQLKRMGVLTDHEIEPLHELETMKTP